MDFGQARRTNYVISSAITRIDSDTAGTVR
jgi:hypothetical protein